MHGATCGNCGSNEIESDQSRGDTFCIKCGAVIEENLIVSELQFEEGTHGAANLIGQMVSSDANYKSLSSNAFGSATVNSRESREITLENAKRRIKHIGQQLRLNSTCITTAFNFYRMALSKRLTYGRRQANVFAACLYMTCRLELTSHMLLDLSDITQVNIYELGKTYLRLSNALCINIPPIDPCLYIVRFAERLNKLIGIDAEKKRDIEMTALRLVQRMKRDWIHTGRRPSGLCGAALLVSCRLNGIHCNIRDIIRIVQVCETTIRKRLSEFGDTETGRLTLDEFMTVDLEGEEDPPCFKEARKKQKQMIQELNQEQIEGFQDEVTKFQEIIDEKLEDIRTKRHKRFASLMRPSTLEEHNQESETEDSANQSQIEKVSVTHGAIAVPNEPFYLITSDEVHPPSVMTFTTHTVETNSSVVNINTTDTITLEEEEVGGIGESLATTDKNVESLLIATIADADGQVTEVEEIEITSRIIEQETAEVVEMVLQGDKKDEHEFNSETLRHQLELLRPTAKSLGISAPNHSLGKSSSKTKHAGWVNSVRNARAILSAQGTMLARLHEDESDDDDTCSQDREDSGELDLDGIDDDEIDSYILSQSEVCAKTDLWNTVHAEYLEEMRIKEEKEALEVEERAKRNEGPPQAKKKRTTRKRAPIVAVTASEAIEKMLHEKRISSKINYDVLKNLS